MYICDSRNFYVYLIQEDLICTVNSNSQVYNLIHVIVWAVDRKRDECTITISSRLYSCYSFDVRPKNFSSKSDSRNEKSFLFRRSTTLFYIYVYTYTHINYTLYFHPQGCTNLNSKGDQNIFGLFTDFGPSQIQKHLINNDV